MQPWRPRTTRGLPSIARLLVSLGGVGVVAGPGTAADALFTGVGDLPGGIFESRAWDVSDDGSTVVGQSASASGEAEAFVWTLAGGLVGLGDLPGGDFRSAARGVSADGSVVAGSASPEVWFLPEPFRWTSAGGMVRVDPDAGLAAAIGISADGSTLVGSDGGAFEWQAFRWNEGGRLGLGHLPGGLTSTARAASADGSVIVGESGSTQGQRAFVWTSGSGMVSLGTVAGASEAFDVSADGWTIVGETGHPGGGRQAFVWTGTVGMVGLGDLPGGAVASEARGISADGLTVVGVGTGAGGAEAMIWDAANGMRPLRQVMDDLGVGIAGWTLTSAESVSADGRVIVGTGTNPEGDTEGWVARLGDPVPPQIPALGSLALLGTAGAIAAAAARRLRHRPTSPR